MTEISPAIVALAFSIGKELKIMYGERRHLLPPERFEAEFRLTLEEFAQVSNFDMHTLAVQGLFNERLLHDVADTVFDATYGLAVRSELQRHASRRL